MLSVKTVLKYPKLRVLCHQNLRTSLRREVNRLLFYHWRGDGWEGFFLHKAMFQQGVNTIFGHLLHIGKRFFVSVDGVVRSWNGYQLLLRLLGWLEEGGQLTVLKPNLFLFLLQFLCHTCQRILQPPNFRIFLHHPHCKILSHLLQIFISFQ